MNPQRPTIVWTDRMLKLLRDFYPTMFNDALAKWLKVSVRSLERKAKELGIRKVENFNSVRAEGISELLSISIKKAYAEGRMVSPFKKGKRNNPQGEFKPGNRFSEEIERKRVEKIRRTYKNKKFKEIHGL